MGVPILVESTTFVGGVPWPEIEPTMTLGVGAGVAVVPVGVAAMSAFCSRRFWDTTQKYINIQRNSKHWKKHNNKEVIVREKKKKKHVMS